MKYRRPVFQALALVMMAALLLLPALTPAQAALPAAQDAPDVVLNIDNTLAGPIPDGTASTGTGCSNWPFTRYFLVTQHISITDLNLGVNLTHTNRGQVQGKLTAPDGTSYILMATSGDTDNNYDILLDGDGGGTLSAGSGDDITSPYYDRQVLQPAMDNFDGKDAFGGWQLFLCDNTLDGGTDTDGDFNRAQLQITGDPIAFTPPVHTQGPPVVETYYMPWPEDQLWTAMGLIFDPDRVVTGDDTCADFSGYDGNPRQPMLNYSSITMSYAGTVITYDQWEDGYEAVITLPTQSTTEVWGDGNLLNGVAPGDVDDLLVTGQVLILNDVMDSSTLQSVVDFDARDKIASSVPVAVSRSAWSDGSKTLFAHADEVYPTTYWGVDYRLPVGENADLNEMFQYTGVSVMASEDGTVVSIDKDANGTAEMTCNLDEGESCQWTDTYVGGVIGSGLNRNSRITANSGHPIQVNLLTADYCAGYETRSFPLLPVDTWSDSYYNPVGTLTANGGPGADEAPTYVHLYNPNSNIITVNYAMGGGAYSSATIAPHQGTNVQMTNLMGAHFYSSSASAGNYNVRDEFATQSYNNNDGSMVWTNSWDETSDDDNPASGSIQINTTSDHLRFYTGLGSSTVGDMIEREVNLSGATAATLSFAYSNNNGNATDTLQILASSDGGSTWTQVGALIAGNTSGTFSQSIASYISGNTRVRIRINGNSGDSDTTEYISVDNVDISATFPGAAGALPFFAVATVDSENAPTNSGTDRNDRYDWGITLVPERFMSQWLLVGWAPGDDPTFLGTGAENTSPIWLTGGHPIGSATPTATFDVCIDDGGDGGSFTDPNTGKTYDRKITGMAPRSQQKVYNGGTAVAGQDQTAMQLWVCGPNIAEALDSDAVITAAWGEDPLTASPANPAMDMGDTIRNGLRWIVSKDVALWIDINDNGLYDEGDTVRYTIEVQNQGASALPIGSITVVDTPDAGSTYILSSTTVDFGSGATAIPDNGVGTPFPLDTPGYSNGSAIPVNGSMTIVFDAEIDAGTGDTTVCNGVVAEDTSVEQGAQACVPVQKPVLSAIGNYVWFDEDGDGDQDAGEAGIPNVRVELYQDTDNNGSYETLVATTYTDADGGYLFPGLDAGEYRVDVVSTTLPDPDGGGPGGLHQTYDEDEGTGPFTTTPHSTPVSLGSGVEHLTADFGYNWAPPVSTNNPPLDALGAIGDRVWVDTDGDGVQDAGEAGISGVTVQLWYDSDGDGDIDAQLSSTTTNGAGNYIFDQLPQGIYEVRIPTPPAGYTQTGDPDYFGQLLPVAERDNRTTTPIVLGPGDVFLNADFGYQPPAAQNNSIGDKVWFDADADGVGPAGAPGGTDTNEYGIPGVTVALISDLDNDGTWDVGEPIIATDTTDANGDYLFTGLADGSYLVWVNDTEHVLGEVTPTYDANGGVVPPNSSAPTGVASSTRLGISSVINLGVSNPAAVSDLAQDFGYTAIGQGTTSPGAIGDTVFLDANNDGLFQQGEGIEGVVVALFDNNGVKLAVTTTDENGHYYFGNLPVSVGGVTYVVQIQNSTLPNNGIGLLNHVDPDTPSPGNSFSAVTLTSAAPIDLDQDFGYKPATNPGSIGNFIWEDTNADGNVDAGENGIAGVTVDLYEDSNNDGILDGGDHLVGQTVTNGSGGYLFTQLPPGNYLVDVTDDAGVLNGYWHSLGNQTAGADNESKQDPHKVVLAAGQNYIAADFGYYVDPAAVGNRIWLDTNRNGIQDGGELGINGVEVRMTVVYPNGNTTVLTTITANDPVSGAPGWYSFGNLLQDEDYNGAGTYGSEPTYTVSVDTTQPALAGLVASPTGQGTPTTDSNNPAGTLTAPVQGQTNTLFANDAATIASYDFGFMPDLGSIGNYIWLDENSDGYQDAGEPGIPNVRVNLYNASGVLVATTFTDAQGGYLFDNLPAGNYYVDVDETTLPAPGMTQTPYNLPGADFGNQDHSTTTIPSTALTGYPVTLAAGGENLTADFGYNYNPPPDVNNDTGPAALGDRVWIDADGDGVQDPEEAGIGGVSVQIFTAGSDGIFGTGDDVPGLITLTDYNGYYLFDGLVPGAYVVKVITPPAGYTQTGDPDHFATSGTNNDNQTTTPVLLGPGDVFLNADFGYQPPAGQNNSIGNKVWFDADADGVGPGGNGAAPGNDNNEPGIAGVTVALIKDLDNDGTWDLGEPIIATDTTDANGDYLFTGLPDGNYLVWVNDTDNVLGDKRPTYDVNGGLPYLLSGAPTGLPSSTVLGLSASALDPTSVNSSPVNDLTQDFGYTAPTQTPVTGLIGDRVWLDINNDGVQDANESGLEGIQVTLLDANGNELAATYTDENGNYSFGGLPAGTYTVRVSPPAGMTQTYDADGLGTLHESTVTIGPGGINLDQDFGYRGTGTVGNLVWEDLNADGNVDAGENGIGGVTLDLYWDLDGNNRIDPGEPLVGSTVTAPDGSYLFSGLPTDDGGGNAQFVVDVTDEAGKLGGYWHSLGTAGVNDNSQTDPYPVTLTPGAPNNLTADFGYYVKPAAAGNFVWLDDLPGVNGTDANGIQDPGEPGIDGLEVTLTILYPNGATVVVKTITGDDPSTLAVEKGWYSFGNLLLDEDYNASTAGTPSVDGLPKYTISVPTGAGYTPTSVGAGNGMNDSDQHTGVAALVTQGVTNVTQNTNPNAETNPSAGYDFGYTQTPLSVLLEDFQAVGQTDFILVSWQTTSEINNAGFNLYRSMSDTGELMLLTFVPSAVPGGTGGASYTFDDLNVVAGQTYWYWLEAVGTIGGTTMFGPVSGVVSVPTAITTSDVAARSVADNWTWLAVLCGLMLLAGTYSWRRRLQK